MTELLFIIVCICVIDCLFALRRNKAKIKSLNFEIKLLNSKAYYLERKLMSLEESIASLTLGENVLFDVISKKIDGSEWEEVKKVELEL